MKISNQTFVNEFLKKLKRYYNVELLNNRVLLSEPVYKRVIFYLIGALVAFLLFITASFFSFSMFLLVVLTFLAFAGFLFWLNRRSRFFIDFQRELLLVRDKEIAFKEISGFHNRLVTGGSRDSEGSYCLSVFLKNGKSINLFPFTPPFAPPRAYDLAKYLRKQTGFEQT